MGIFKTSLIGYSKKEVDKYLEKQMNSDESIMQKQKQRIIALREENTHLNVRLNGYRHREKAILAAMVDSRRQAENILKESRKQAIRELRDLKDDINYIKCLDKLTPCQLAMALDKTCMVLSRYITEIEDGESI